MPLLSEETDSQSEIDDGLPVVPPDSNSSDKPQSHSDTSYSQDPENTANGVIQEAACSDVEDLITSSAAQHSVRHSALTSYTVVPETTCHDKENHMNDLSDIQGSLDLTSHHHLSESTLETVAHSNEGQTVPEMQTASIGHDDTPVATENLDSAPAHSNLTPECTSEASVEDSSTSDTNHSSSHLASDHSSHTSYGHVPESSSELSGSVTSSQTQFATALPSFTEISENVVTHKLGMNSASDEAIFEDSSKMPSKSSSSNLQAESQAATSDECVDRTCYLQIPESTNAEDRIVTNDATKQVLDSSKITCNTQCLTSFHKGFDNACEVRETRSDLEPEKEDTVTSYLPDSASHNVTSDTVAPSQPISNVPHSMPLLVDEPMTESSDDCTEPGQALDRSSPLREDDMEIPEEIRLEQSER
jgi:hypothetical protein